VDNYKINLIGDKDDIPADVSIYSDDKGICYIELKHKSLIITAQDYDFFDAFCKIRKKLEKESLIPFCYAASLNHYPSSMSRSMGLGLKSYKRTLNEPCKENPVNIFSSGVDVIPVYVENQEKFHQDWVESIQNKKSFLSKLKGFFIKSNS